METIILCYAGDTVYCNDAQARIGEADVHGSEQNTTITVNREYCTISLQLQPMLQYYSNHLHSTSSEEVGRWNMLELPGPLLLQKPNALDPWLYDRLPTGQVYRLVLVDYENKASGSWIGRTLGDRVQCYNKSDQWRWPRRLLKSQVVQDKPEQWSRMTGRHQQAGIHSRA